LEEFEAAILTIIYDLFKGRMANRRPLNESLDNVEGFHSFECRRPIIIAST